MRNPYKVRQAEFKTWDLNHGRQPRDLLPELEMGHAEVKPMPDNYELFQKIQELTGRVIHLENIVKELQANNRNVIKEELKPF